ncbi:hypothetical protein, partial [Pedobacter sp. ISL-64]
MKKSLLFLSTVLFLSSCISFSSQPERAANSSGKKENTEISDVDFSKPVSERDLVAIAKGTEINKVKKLAINSLKDEANLFHIASFDDDIAARKIAVARLTNQANLFHIASFNDDADVRKIAIA